MTRDNKRTKRTIKGIKKVFGAKQIKKARKKIRQGRPLKVIEGFVFG